MGRSVRGSVLIQLCNCSERDVNPTSQPLDSPTDGKSLHFASKKWLSREQLNQFSLTRRNSSASKLFVLARELWCLLPFQGVIQFAIFPTGKCILCWLSTQTSYIAVRHKCFNMPCRASGLHAFSIKYRSEDKRLLVN